MTFSFVSSCLTFSYSRTSFISISINKRRKYGTHKDYKHDHMLRGSNTKNIICLSLMLSDCSFTMLLCELS